MVNIVSIIRVNTSRGKHRQHYQSKTHHVVNIVSIIRVNTSRGKHRQHYQSKTQHVVNIVSIMRVNATRVQLSVPDNRARFAGLGDYCTQTQISTSTCAMSA